MSEATSSVRSPSNDRPILDEAKRKAIIGVVGSLASAGVTFGVLTPEMATKANSTVVYVMGAILTLLPLITSILHALGIVKGAEPKTTPADSPVDAAGNVLVPLHATGLDQPAEEGTIGPLYGGDEEAVADADTDVVSDDTDGVPVLAPEATSAPTPPALDEPEETPTGPSTMDGIVPPPTLADAQPDDGAPGRHQAQ